MQHRKPSLRTEYRRRETQRVNDSITLAEKFPQLKSLTVYISYCDPAGVPRHGGMKYKPNLSAAKSVFYFSCPSGQCVGGDFDLSDELSKAILSRRKVATGEKPCQGWHTMAGQERVPCRQVLRFTLNLGY